MPGKSYFAGFRAHFRGSVTVFACLARSAIRARRLRSLCRSSKRSRMLRRTATCFSLRDAANSSSRLRPVPPFARAARDWPSALRGIKEKAPCFSAGMNPTRSCYSISYGGLPEFPRRDTPALPVQALCVHVPRGNKSDDPLRHVPAHGPDANGGTQQAEYPAVEGRTVFAPSKRPARPGGKAPLTGLYALERTPLVIIGRQPLTWDAKAYFATEDTRNLALPFGESSPFRAGRMPSS